MSSREYWLTTLLKTSAPLFEALAEDRLRQDMPCEVNPSYNNNAPERAKHTHLEAVGRALAGIGPWLNIRAGQLSGEERKQHERFLRLVRAGLDNATNPQTRDFLNFADGAQRLVDAAFLAQGLLRSWDNVWMVLEQRVRDNIISCLLQTREVKPHFCNWLLFSAMIEVFLCKAGASWDRMRVDYALRQHEQWYYGDGAYGDGPSFHWDYYNSFVIQPMLYDIIHCGGAISDGWRELQEGIDERLYRYVVVQERMIAADGSFPPVGRSLTYRAGAFQALALVAYRQELPKELSPTAVREALTAVLHRTMDPEGTFDDNGWLRIGLAGHQPSLGERYISTGSLYLCLCAFLPLGLPPQAAFWSGERQEWSSRRIWAGEDMAADHALD